MKLDQWNQLTPSHQAEVWPTLTDEARADILAADPGAVKRIAAEFSQEMVHAPRIAAPTVLTPAPGRNSAAAVRPLPTCSFVCFAFAVLSVIGGIVWVIDGRGSEFGPSFGIACVSSSVLWWALGEIVKLLDRIASKP